MAFIAIRPVLFLLMCTHIQRMSFLSKNVQTIVVCKLVSNKVVFHLQIF